MFILMQYILGGFSGGLISANGDEEHLSLWRVYFGGKIYIPKLFSISVVCDNIVLWHIILFYTQIEILLPEIKRN